MFIALYYRELSADFMIFILIFVENCLWFDSIHDFSVWLRTGSILTDSNRFRSHTGKYYSINKVHGASMQMSVCPSALHTHVHAKYDFNNYCLQSIHFCIQLQYLPSLTRKYKHTYLYRPLNTNTNEAILPFIVHY